MKFIWKLKVFLILSDFVTCEINFYISKVHSTANFKKDLVDALFIVGV